MSRNYMCDYGNCLETMSGLDYMLTVTERKRGTVQGQRRYCCLEHMWRSTKEQDERLNGPRPAPPVLSGGHP